MEISLKFDHENSDM